jgi:hypothetical protein
MKSEDLYRVLRQELASWFKEHGFRRGKRGQLGWYREPAFVWFQCDNWGWDPYAGSSFFVNFQGPGSPEPWGGPTERLQHFLSEPELEEARAIQNRVITKLSLPPAEYVRMLRDGFAKTSPNPDLLIKALLDQFKPVDYPYRCNQDFSLRYHDPEDVSRWASFLLRVLPGIVQRMGAA